MTLIKFPDPRARSWPPGPAGFLYRVRDLIDRGRLEIGQIRLHDTLTWLLGQGRGGSTLGELCGILEAAARLLVLKSRGLTGVSQDVLAEDVLLPWAGPPPELPLRRSWLGERIASGPLSFVGPTRSYEAATPSLMPVSPEQVRTAMQAAIARAKRPLPLLAPRIVHISVEQTSAFILEELARRGELRLHDVAGQTRDAHVAAFLACLTLARQGRIALVQEELFGQISICSAAVEAEALA